jgi:hypothetical protein
MMLAMLIALSVPGRSCPSGAICRSDHRISLDLASFHLPENMRENFTPALLRLRDAGPMPPVRN